MSAAEFAGFATRLAGAAREVVLGHYRKSFEIIAKDDESPVTIADRNAEQAMRRLIEAEYPDHGIEGEEHGIVRENARYLWVLDPIDGTKSFVIGRPLFGTLIALLEDGEPILGIIDHPALNERWIGGKDYPTELNGRRVKVRACPGLADTFATSTTPDLFEGDQVDKFQALVGAVRQMSYGGDCYGYSQLSAGMLDLVVENGLKNYDHQALVPVIEAAGGIVTDWNGNPMRRGAEGHILATGDRRVHDAALEILG